MLRMLRVPVGHRFKSAIGAKKAKTNSAKKGKSSASSGGGDTLNDPRLQTVLNAVTPLTPNNAENNTKNVDDEMRVIENTWTQYQEHRFLQKRDELERMHAKMREACIALEHNDVRLFKLAMQKPMGEYFPIERRVFVDAPSLNGWNHANDVPTGAFKQQQPSSNKI